jgi:hypothetical protein
MVARRLHPSNYSIVDNDGLPSCYGQPANINAHCEFDAAELGALGIQTLLMMLSKDSTESSNPYCRLVCCCAANYQKEY